MIDQDLRAYSNQFAHALDNELMLNWYPRRVAERSGGGKGLELGIGHGFSTKFFERHFSSFTVVEGAAEIIRQFRAAHPSTTAHIVASRFETFDTDERYDVIVMGFVLEHVDDPMMILSRFRRFLAPRGKIVIAVPNGASLHRRFGKAAGLLDDFFALSPHDRMLGHRRLFTLETLNALTHAAALKQSWVEGLFLKPLTTAQLAQLELSPQVLQSMMEVGKDYPELCAGLLMEVVAT